MQHYLVERKDIAVLLVSYPYSPEDRPQTYMDYLEAKFSAGWELVAFEEDNGSAKVIAVFRPNAV